MSVAVVGGMKRLEAHYRREADKLGFTLEVFNTDQADLVSKLSRFDVLVLFTNRVSHNARRETLRAAQHGNIPLFQYHSCGLCTLRNCLDCLARMDLN